MQPVQQLQKKKERAYTRLREEYDVLIKHSNTLQAEKAKFQDKIGALNYKLRQQKAISKRLEQDKDFIFNEFEAYRKAVNEKLESSKQVLSAFETLKGKNQKAKHKSDKWRIKYHELLSELQQTETEARQLKKEYDILREKLDNTKPDGNSIFEWESNYKELKLRYLALAKEKKDLENKMPDFEATIQALKDANNNELLALKLKNQKLEAENKILAGKLKKPEVVNDPEEKEAILSRIGRKKDKVDFGRIGKASPAQKDNLQLIKGIGPFIEQKLNALGIFHFKQIAHFKEEDIDEINHIIELAPGHIKMDDWVGQASRMK